MHCIRRATVEDCGALAVLCLEHFTVAANQQPLIFQPGTYGQAYLESFVSDERAAVFILEEDGCAVGFVMMLAQFLDAPFFTPRRYGYLADIMVTEQKRRKGYGSQLMEAALAWAQEKNLNFIDLEVLSNNDAARRLYEKYGYAVRRHTMIKWLK